MKQRYTKLSRWLMAVFCTAALLFIIFSPSQKLKLIDDAGNQLASFNLGEDKQFSVEFIHSVNQSPVIETYKINADKIVLVSCKYYSFGAGVATTMQPGWKLQHNSDGSMLITGINQVISNLSYIVGTVSDHILTIDNRKISLTELCGKNRSVRFVWQ